MKCYRGLSVLTRVSWHGGLCYTVRRTYEPSTWAWSWDLSGISMWAHIHSFCLYITHINVTLIPQQANEGLTPNFENIWFCTSKYRTNVHVTVIVFWIVVLCTCICICLWVCECLCMGLCRIRKHNARYMERKLTQVPLHSVSQHTTSLTFLTETHFLGRNTIFIS